MHRSASLVLLLCLAASLSSAAIVDDKNVNNDIEEVEPQVVLVGESANHLKAVVGWPWGSTTPRSRPSSPRYMASTPRRPSTTTRRPSTTPRRPSTTTKRPTSTTPRSQDQSITWGGVYPYDQRLASKVVYKAATWLQVNTESVTISSPSATIHCIQVLDQLQNGKNAVVTMQRGGVGQRTAELKFKSQRGEKISYIVVVWGQ